MVVLGGGGERQQLKRQQLKRQQLNGNNLQGFNDFCLKNGSEQGQKLALAGLLVPGSMTAERVLLARARGGGLTEVT